MVNKITTKAELDVKGVTGALDDVIDRTGDAETKGKEFARTMSRMADDIEADLLDTRSAADALGTALGPELAGKIGQNGLDKMVADMKQLGLTSDDIRTDVDELADGIRRLDSVGATLNGPQKGLNDVRDSAQRAKGEVGELRGEADKSGSVMANMAGNTAQDLGAIAGAGSTAGMAIGQLAEYATEGGISMQGLAKVAGPMAGLTVVTMAVAKGAQQAAERAKQLQQAFKDLSTATDKQVLESVSRMFLTMAIDGKSANETFGEMAKTNIEGTRRLRDLAAQAGANEVLLGALDTAIGEYDRSTAQAAETTAKYGDQLAGAGADADDSAAKLQGYSYAVYDVEEATKRATDEVKSHEEATKRMVDAANRELDRYRNKWKQVQGTLSDDEAWLNLQTQFDEVKAKAEAAIGGTEQDVRDAALAMDGLKRSVIDYGVEVLGLPDEKMTRVFAAVQPESLAEAEALLANLTRNRDVSLSIIAKGGAGYEGTRGRPSASGDPYTSARWYQTQENGPEDIWLPSGAKIRHAGDTRNDRAMAPTVIDRSQTIVHAPPGVDLRSLVDAQTRSRRQGYRLPLLVRDA